ncbi:MAG: thioredoxin domain-containing protein [Candidatus Paceibacterota bacterium]|jgi:protein-disulfide isomerase
MDSNKIMIPLSVLVAGGLIAGAVFLSQKNPAKDPAAGTDTTKQELSINAAPVTDADYILGDPKAPIVIIEYSDLECPACKYFQGTTNKVMETYGKEGKVALVFRHFPLYKGAEGYKPLHSKAGKEAEAVECAGELGGSESYYKMIDKIFSVTPSNNGLDLATLPTLAKEIGLDQTKFTACLDSNKYADKVEAAYNAAVKAGVRATPSYVIVTKSRTIPQEGGVPFEAIKPVIDTLLTENN